MLTNEQLAAALDEIARKMDFPAAEVERRLAMATNPAYWQSVVPFATIERPAAVEDCGGDAPDVAREVDRLEKHGYFRFGPVIGEARVSRMRRCVEALRNAGWPAVFPFVFDDFWNVARTEPTATFLERALGPGYRQNSRVWSHWVDGHSGANGWLPHVDQGESDYRKRLSIWIPLTDATIGNGCMFAVPRSAQRPDVEMRVGRRAALESADYLFLLQNTLPLPAVAGSVLGWDGNIVHWGGVNRGDPNPRLSLALEFLAADAPGRATELPLVDPAQPLPTMRERLFAIATGLSRYGRFEVEINRFATFSKRLLELTRPDREPAASG